MQTIDFAAIAGSMLILGTVLGLVARGRLKPRYALLWTACASSLVLVSVWRESIDQLGEFFGVVYKPALLFLGTDIFLILILLHQSVVTSGLSDRIRDLAQEVALLKEERE